jgi:hypothetical protein
VVVSFAKLRRYLEQELENVVVRKQAGASKEKGVIFYTDFNTVLNPVQPKKKF